MKNKVINEELILEKLKISFRECIYEDPVDISSYTDHMTGEFIIEMAKVLSGVVEHTISCHEKWPVTWWDAIKDRWFPKWLKNRWNINYKAIDIEQNIYKAICPHLPTDPTRDHVSWVYREMKKTTSAVPAEIKKTFLEDLNNFLYEHKCEFIIEQNGKADIVVDFIERSAPSIYLGAYVKNLDNSEDLEAKHNEN